ncbi:MAG: hypothetical protein ICV73_06355, partial [Acetobacteraceae bacterium]|nr:hypothetical protein [Acetobacteraceae bacterium]
MPAPPDAVAGDFPSEAAGDVDTHAVPPGDHEGDATPDGASPGVAADDGGAFEDRDAAARARKAAADPADHAAEAPAAALVPLPDGGQEAEPEPAPATDPALFAHALRIAEA